jgi:hypothetical protein
MDEQAIGQQRWVIARHEAAHAVVDHVLGGRVREVEIEPWPIVNGRVFTEWPDHDLRVARPDPVAIRPILVGLLAGHIAQYIAEGGSSAEMAMPSLTMTISVRMTLMLPPNHSRQDDPFKVARVVAAMFPGDIRSAEEYVDSLTIESERLVRRHWGDIDRIATAALERAKLDRSEFLVLQ